MLADPLAYVSHIVLRLPPLLTGSVENDATAAGLVQYGRQEYAIAGGPGQLGVSSYDYGAELEAAQVLRSAFTVSCTIAIYAWVFLALAAFGGTRYYGRSALLVAVILAITVLVSAGTISGIVGRYRYPVTWAIYLLAATGAAGAAWHAARHPDAARGAVAQSVAYTPDLAHNTAWPIAAACRADRHCGRPRSPLCGTPRLRSWLAGGSAGGCTRH